jgi:hypothetical protein
VRHLYREWGWCGEWVGAICSLGFVPSNRADRASHSGSVGPGVAIHCAKIELSENKRF